jgi:hypothetical protein
VRCCGREKTLNRLPVLLVVAAAEPGSPSLTPGRLRDIPVRSKLKMRLVGSEMDGLGWLRCVHAPSIEQGDHFWQLSVIIGAGQRDTHKPHGQPLPRCLKASAIHSLASSPLFPCYSVVFTSRAASVAEMVTWGLVLGRQFLPDLSWENSIAIQVLKFTCPLPVRLSVCLVGREEDWVCAMNAKPTPPSRSLPGSHHVHSVSTHLTHLL